MKQVTVEADPDTVVIQQDNLETVVLLSPEVEVLEGMEEGPQGPPGPVGPPSVIPGPKGDQGEQGPVGPVGPQGIVEDAPADSVVYGRMDYGWWPVTSPPASSIAFAPVGNLAATDVQAALAEVDTEKVAKAGDTMTGTLNITPLTLGSSLGLNPVQAAQQAFMYFKQTNVDKWILGKQTDNSFLLHDSVKNAGVFSTTSNGSLLNFYRNLWVNSAGSANLTLNKAGSSYNCSINSYTNNSIRWVLELGNGTAESGGSAGSNLALSRYDDAGGILGGGNTLSIDRASGKMTYGGDIHVMRPASLGTGTVYFGNTATKYLHYDGTNFNIAGGALTITGPVYANGGVFTQALQAAAGGDNPIYANVLYCNPSWADCWLSCLHYPALWVGWRFNIGGTLYDFRSDTAYKPGGGVWSDISDARIKNVVGEYTSGLDAVAALRPVRFTYKGNDTDALPSSTGDTEGETPGDTGTVPYKNSFHYTAAVSGKEFYGVVAQEAELAMPELVTQKSGFIDGIAVTDLRDVDTTPLVWALINAVKELKARVEQLEAAR